MANIVISEEERKTVLIKALARERLIIELQKELLYAQKLIAALEEQLSLLKKQLA